MGLVTIGIDVGAWAAGACRGHGWCGPGLAQGLWGSPPPEARHHGPLAHGRAESRPVGERVEVHFLIRHLERLPLGTPYPRVAQRVARITGQVRARTGESPTIYMDATGVGQPVLDILRAEIPGGRLVGVYFTHGDRRTETRLRGNGRSRWARPSWSPVSRPAPVRPAPPTPDPGGRGLDRRAAHLRAPGRRERKRSLRRLQGRHARRPRHRSGPRRAGGSPNRHGPVDLGHPIAVEESGTPMRYGEPQPFVGVGPHLGQGREPTGLCVVEVQDCVGTETTPARHPTGKPRIVRWRAPGRPGHGAGAGRPDRAGRVVPGVSWSPPRGGSPVRSRPG